MAYFRTRELTPQFGTEITGLDPNDALHVEKTQKQLRHLFDTSCGFIMKAYIDDMMLLIYSSEMLPPDSQC